MAQALRSIEVAVRRKATTDGDGTHVFVTHTVEWRDGGEVVTFGEFLKWDQERAWLVGEVLAWLQQVGPCTMQMVQSCGRERWWMVGRRLGLGCSGWAFFALVPARAAM
jgi:hypothetical protein